MLLPNLAPLGDLKFATPGGVLHGAVDSLTPFIKTPLELAMNRDLFFDAPLRRYPGEKVEYLGVQVPPEVAHIAQLARPINEVQRIVRGVQQGEGATEIAGRFAGARVFGDNLPREIHREEIAQAQARGFMRAKARMNIADGDVKGAEAIAQTFENIGMGEDAIKTRIMISQGRGDFAAARDLSRQLAEDIRQRKSREASPTQIQELSKVVD